MRKILVMMTAIIVLAYTTPAQAIVHHCDYDPTSKMTEVHNKHSGSDETNGCSNIDNESQPVDGTCDYSSIFFHTDMTCNSSGCNINGTLDCPGGDINYDISCGAGALTYATRTAVSCWTDMFEEYHHCDCANGCS